MFEQPGPDSIFVSAMRVSKNQVNPLTPNSDQHQISPCNISALLNSFSLLAHLVRALHLHLKARVQYA